MAQSRLNPASAGEDGICTRPLIAAPHTMDLDGWEWSRVGIWPKAIYPAQRHTRDLSPPRSAGQTGS